MLKVKDEAKIASDSTRNSRYPDYDRATSPSPPADQHDRDSANIFGPSFPAAVTVTAQITPSTALPVRTHTGIESGIPTPSASPRRDEFSTARPVKSRQTLYRHLSFQKAEIRLLTFSSQPTGDTLQCSLTAVPLPKSPPYIALSYMWGDPTDTVPILVNDVEVQVTVNLRKALSRLKAGGVTHIWADALCINQGDSEERTAQVGRMGTIFRKASEVAVWLGPEQQVMEQALRVYEAKDLNEETRPDLSVFRNLLSQSYWKRVWIIQEIAVASHINVYCGDFKIEWDRFVDMCLFGADALVAKTRSEDDNISGFLTLLELRDDTLARKPVRFLDALHRSRSSLSTDPRDKLYALLGLTYDGRHFIPEPNYMYSFAESFTDFTSALIEGGELLDFIYLRSASRKNDGDLPSWVPDWSDLYDTVAHHQLDWIMSCMTSPTDSESIRVLRRCEIDSSTNELTVNGVFIDTIDNLGGLSASDRGDNTADAPVTSDKLQMSGNVAVTGDFLYQLMVDSGAGPQTNFTELQCSNDPASFPLELDFFIQSGWISCKVSYQAGDHSFISNVMTRLHGLNPVNGFIHLPWSLPRGPQAYITRFLVKEDLDSDFVFGLHAWDNPITGDWDNLITGRKDWFFEQVQQYWKFEIARYRQALEQDVTEQIPLEILPQFKIWFSENISLILAHGPLKSLIPASIFHPPETNKAETGIFHYFYMCMQSGRRLMGTESGFLGLVHPMAQKGDKIVRIFGCSEFVVLRALDSEGHHQVIGDAFFGSRKVGQTGDVFDEAKHIKIL